MTYKSQLTIAVIQVIILYRALPTRVYCIYIDENDVDNPEDGVLAIMNSILVYIQQFPKMGHTLYHLTYIKYVR